MKKSITAYVYKEWADNFYIYGFADYDRLFSTPKFYANKEAIKWQHKPKEWRGKEKEFFKQFTRVRITIEDIKTKKENEYTEEDRGDSIVYHLKKK